MALDLKKTIKGLSFFTKNLRFFGTKEVEGDQFVFDMRGAVRISDTEVKKPNGEIVKMRGIVDAGKGKSFTPSDPMLISRPSTGSTVDASAAMDAYHSWAYAAIKPISDEIAGIEWRFFKVNRDGEREEVQNHPLIDFLETVNNFQTGPEFKHTLAAHLELTGNAYIFLEGVKDFETKPKAMYLLDPGHVRINVNKTTYPYQIVNYEFVIDGKRFVFQPYEILQIKYPNPSNPFVGIGTVQAAAEWIDNDNKSTEFLKQFFDNGAQIGAIFETDMTSEEQLQALKDSFDEQHAGVRNAYKGLFLPKGVKKPSTDVSFNDIGYDQISNTNRDKILAAFRVPKTVIGAAESDTNRATAETADYVFARRTIKPKMILICSYLNEFLVPRFGDDLILSFEDPVTEDRASMSALMKNSVGNLPVISQNEAREEYLNLEPIEGGEKLLIPNNFTDATNSDETLGTGGGIVMESMKNKVKNPRRAKAGYMPIRMSPGKSQFSRNVKIRNEMKEALSDKILAIMTVKTKSLKEMTDTEYDDVILKDKRDRAGAAAKKMEAVLKGLNQKQEAEVLDNLERAMKAQKKVNARKLFNLKSWIALTIEGLSGPVREQFADEAERALRLIDKPGLDVANTPAAKQALKHALSLMSSSYNSDTLDMLERKLNQGLNEGLSVGELSDIIRDVYAFKDVTAAERLALTESNRIANMAGKIAWQESGVVKEVQWVTSKRDNVCVFCADMEGEIIPVKDNFWDKGDTYEVDGETMNLDYSAVGGPPLHPNCHCGIRPIVDTTIEAGVESPEDLEAKEAIAELQNE